MQGVRAAMFYLAIVCWGRARVNAKECVCCCHQGGCRNAYWQGACLQSSSLQLGMAVGRLKCATGVGNWTFWQSLLRRAGAELGAKRRLVPRLRAHWGGWLRHDKVHGREYGRPCGMCVGLHLSGCGWVAYTGPESACDSTVSEGVTGGAKPDPYPFA